MFLILRLQFACFAFECDLAQANLAQSNNYHFSAAMIYPSKRALEKCKDSSAPLPAKAPKKASSWSPQTPKSEKSDQTTPCKQVDQDPVNQAPVKVVPRSAAKPRNPKKPRSPLAKKSRSQKKPRSPLAKKPGSPKKLRSPSAKKPGSPKSSPEAKSKTLKVGQRSPKSSGRVINLVTPSPKAKAECESPCATQVRKSNVNNTWDITIGTDFSGPDTPRIALQNMGYRVKQLWSCEKQMNCRKLASHTWGKKYSSQVFKNVLGRDPKLLPSCDLYISGVPCPPWARGGKREGLECEDGKLWKETILVVRHVQPKAFVIENVFGLLDNKFKATFDDILKALAEAGYHVFYRVLDTSEHGLPQLRRRVYIVGVNRRVRPGRVDFKWPEPLPATLPLDDVIGSPPPALACLQPLDRFQKMLPPPTMTRARKNVLEALKNIAKADPGVDVYQDNIVVDIGCSMSHLTKQVNVFPTITATRGRSRAWWLLRQGRQATVRDLCRLQGVPDGTFDIEGCKITPAVLGHMVGNMMSVNVLERLLPRVLDAIGCRASMPTPDPWLALQHRTSQ